MNIFHLFIFQPNCHSSHSHQESTKPSESPIQVNIPTHQEYSMSPAARAILTRHRLDASSVKASGKGGRITKADVVTAIATGKAKTVVPQEKSHATNEATPTELVTPTNAIVQETKKEQTRKCPS